MCVSVPLQDQKGNKSLVRVSWLKLGQVTLNPKPFKLGQVAPVEADVGILDGSSERGMP